MKLLTHILAMLLFTGTLHAQDHGNWGVGFSTGVQVIKFRSRSPAPPPVSPEYIYPYTVSSKGHNLSLTLTRVIGRLELQAGIGYVRLQTETIRDYSQANWSNVQILFGAKKAWMSTESITDHFVEVPFRVNYIFSDARISFLMGAGISAYYLLGYRSHSRNVDVEGGVSEWTWSDVYDIQKIGMDQRIGAHVSIGLQYHLPKDLLLRIEPALHYRQMIAAAGHELNGSATISILRCF